jgi:pilus assembly protein CpaB
MKGKKFFLLSLILALAAAAVVYNYMNEMERQSKSAANLVQVYVASSEIPARTRLDATMFTVAEIPKNALHQDAVTDRTVLTGAYAQERLVAGEQILTSRLAYEKSRSGLAFRVTEGHRAVTVAVNNVSGVAGFILPGDHVDCIVTIDPPTGNSGDDKLSLTTVVASNVKVLASGQYIYQQESEQLVVDTVTLDTPLDWVTAIIQASERGSLRLVLRPVEEAGGFIRAHRINQFQQTSNTPPPPPPPTQNQD